MDIEKLKKINSLTKELRGQQFETTSEEAYVQAQQIINPEENEKRIGEGPDSEIKMKINDKMDSQREKEVNKKEVNKKEVNKKEGENATNEYKEPETKGEQASSAFDQERIKLLLEMQMNEYLQKMNQMQEKIKELEQEVEVLKNNSSGSEIKIETTPESKTTQEKKKNSQTPLPPPPKKEKQYSEKRGEYNSEDVAIDKMFYFGNKKKED